MWRLDWWTLLGENFYIKIFPVLLVKIRFSNEFGLRAIQAIQLVSERYFR